jgi:hypothetical protein
MTAKEKISIAAIALMLDSLSLWNPFVSSEEDAPSVEEEVHSSGMDLHP